MLQHWYEEVRRAVRPAVATKLEQMIQENSRSYPPVDLVYKTIDRDFYIRELDGTWHQLVKQRKKGWREAIGYCWITIKPIEHSDVEEYRFVCKYPDAIGESIFRRALNVLIRSLGETPQNTFLFLQKASQEEWESNTNTRVEYNGKGRFVVVSDEASALE